MRKQLRYIVYLLALFAVFCYEERARGEEPKKAAALKLSELDFTKLKLATTSIELAKQRAQIAVAQANTEISSFSKELQEICDAYKIDCTQLDKMVNAKGDIIRNPDLMMPKDKKPPKK